MALSRASRWGPLLAAAFLLNTVFAQNPTPAAPVTEAEFRGAINQVEELARSLDQEIKIYREHLKAAMEKYGSGFYDPALRQKLAGFAADIQSGDPDQTENMRMIIFASLLKTAGVHLDPDPLRDWGEIQKHLDDFQNTVDNARLVVTRGNIFVAGSTENIPLKELRKLTKQWHEALKHAEKQRAQAESIRPVNLKPGETLDERATEGRSPHFEFFGLQIGREGANIKALARLTYSGRAAAGDFFLLTVLTARDVKSHPQTFVKPRAILLYSNTEDPLRYGYAVTAHDHGGYLVLNELVVDAASNVRDWVWKKLATPGASQPALADLETGVRGVQESGRDVNRAVDAFLRLASQAVRENDNALKAEARREHREARVPEQDLQVFFPDVRAHLYAVRAVLAGDPRFLAAMNTVRSARDQAGIRIHDAGEMLAYFNAIPVYAAPDLPWKDLDKLAASLMSAAEEVQRASSRAEEKLPRIPRQGELAITPRTGAPPGVIVAQENRGPEQPAGRNDDPTLLVVEHILRDVHPAVKGIERREYSSEVIKTSRTTGIHHVQRVLGPAYITGPGGIGQIFHKLTEPAP